MACEPFGLYDFDYLTAFVLPYLHFTKCREIVKGNLLAVGTRTTARYLLVSIVAGWAGEEGEGFSNLTTILATITRSYKGMVISN